MQRSSLQIQILHITIQKVVGRKTFHHDHLEIFFNENENKDA